MRPVPRSITSVADHRTGSATIPPFGSGSASTGSGGRFRDVRQNVRGQHLQSLDVVHAKPVHRQLSDPRVRIRVDLRHDLLWRPDNGWPLTTPAPYLIERQIREF